MPTGSQSVQSHDLAADAKLEFCGSCGSVVPAKMVKQHWDWHESLLYSSKPPNPK